jgi:hypothetical protein
MTTYLLSHPALRRTLFICSNKELSATSVNEKPRGASEVDCGPELHFLQILRHLASVWEPRMDAGEVDFDDEVYEAMVVVTRRGRVGTDDQLAIDPGTE